MWGFFFSVIGKIKTEVLAAMNRRTNLPSVLWECQVERSFFFDRMPEL